MKPNIHPEYRTVVFHDTSVDEYFKIGSTIKTDREIELDGYWASSFLPVIL